MWVIRRRKSFHHRHLSISFVVLLISLLIGYGSSWGDGLSETWESAIPGSVIPHNYIKADMGEWFIGDTISGDPVFCGPPTNFATIVQDTDQNKFLNLISDESTSSCAENIWASINTNIPIIPFTRISFFEEGNFLNTPQPGVSYCIFPPCNDSIYLALTDNLGNRLAYVMQYPENFTKAMNRPYYGEIYLTSIDNLYSRDISNDFKAIPEFVSENASLRHIEFSISTNGHASIDNILTYQATPPPEYNCASTTCSSFPYALPSGITYSDSLGDSCFPFIDLKNMTVNVDASTVTVTITVADLPSLFQFNQPGVPKNNLEYQWAVNFNINDDNETNGDIRMSLSHFKYSNTSFQGPLMDNLEKGVYRYTSNTSATWIGNLTGQISGNTLTLSVNKSVHSDLSAITNSTKVRFRASYYYPYRSKLYYDTYPDCLSSSSDTIPDQFTFTDQTNAALNTIVTSNTITVSAVNTATAISITGGAYSINGGAYTSTAGTVNNGDTVTVQQTSSGSYSTPTNVTLTIGGVSDIFSAVTQVSPYFDQVQKVYIAYYGRPGDPSGVIWWANKLDEVGGNLSAIMDSFGNSVEATNLHAGQNTSQLVNSLYQQLFGRDAEEAGLAYWVGRINDGSITLPQLALVILNAAQNEDRQSVDNKLAAANLLPEGIDPERDGGNFQVTYDGDGDATAGRNFLSLFATAVKVPTKDETIAYIKDHVANPSDAILKL